MKIIYSVRLTPEERDSLQSKAQKLGFRSGGNLARVLIQRGLDAFQIKKIDEHILFNSVQSVMLLREIVAMLAGEEDKSTQIIHGIKHSAEDWLEKFKGAIGE